MPEDSESLEFARRVRQLRDALAASQGDLARHLHVSAVAVSQWERGKRVPTADRCLEMGNLCSPGPSRQWFWARSRVDVSRLDSNKPPSKIQPKKAAPTARASPPGGSSHAPPKHPDIVYVPLLKNAHAVTVLGELPPEDIESYMPVRVSDLKHPDETVFIHVPDDSMAPILEDGYILALDLHRLSREALNKEMVVVRTPDGDVTIRWLRRSGKEYMLVAQRGSAQFMPAVLNPASGWTILGRVVFWRGSPSRYQKEGLVYPSVGMTLVKGKKGSN